MNRHAYFFCSVHRFLVVITLIGRTMLWFNRLIWYLLPRQLWLCTVGHSISSRQSLYFFRRRPWTWPWTPLIRPWPRSTCWRWPWMWPWARRPWTRSASLTGILLVGRTRTCATRWRRWPGSVFQLNGAHILNSISCSLLRYCTANLSTEKNKQWVTSLSDLTFAVPIRWAKV